MTNQAAVQAVVVTATEMKEDRATQLLALFNPDGTPVSFSGGGGPALTPDNNLSDVSVRQTALNNLAGAVTTGHVLRGDGTNVALAAIQASDIPTLNQSTTGNAATATLATTATTATTATSATSATTATTAGTTTGNAATATNLAGGAVFPAYTAPKVTALTYSTTPAIDASLGNVFTLTLTASTATIQNPTNPHDGQIFHLRLKQDATGSRTVSWGTAYDWGTTSGSANSAPTLTTAASKTDVLGFEYDADISKWVYLSAPFPQGF